MKDKPHAPTGLTVKQLITELKKYPEDLEVITEGCDCYGAAAGVELDHIFGPVIVIIRERTV